MARKLTNKNNIPELFARACEIDRHRTYGDISVTQLIDAPQIRFLKATEEVTEDVSDMLWMLFGTAMHHILERAEVGHASARQLIDAAVTLDEIGGGKTGGAADYLRELARSEFPDAFNSEILVEKTVSVVVKGKHGTLELSGTCDKFEVAACRLRDYKLTSTYAYTYEESKKKWYAQLNVYAFMFREMGYEVDEAVITALFKDWKTSGKFHSKDYPPSMVMDIPVKLYPHEKVKKYVEDRIDLHLRAMNRDVVPCTEKERWASASVWKVQKVGAKRALNHGVFDNEAQAIKFMSDNEIKYPKLEIIHKPGENKRCENYCPCSGVCPQFKKIKEAQR